MVRLKGPRVKTLGNWRTGGGNHHRKPKRNDSIVLGQKYWGVPSRERNEGPIK